MGVQGLWKLLESTGRTVPLEALTGKVLAVDISIWLNQIIKAMRDQDGNRISNSHIISVYHRLCKLLFYRVKPIIVFDGVVPLIKLKTCGKRRDLKKKAEAMAVRQNECRVKLRLQKLAVAHVTGKPVKTSAKTKTKSVEMDMFYLDDDKVTDLVDHPHGGLQNVPLYVQNTLICQQSKVDPFSKDFKSLPAEIQYELLLEHLDDVKYKAKASSYAQIGSSLNFSDYQIQNVLAKNGLSVRLRELRKELNKPEPGVRQGDHSVHLIRSGEDSEIVFTKQINSVDYDIINTKEDKKPEVVLPEIQIPIQSEQTSANLSEEISQTDEMKNIFFGSDSDEIDHENSSSDDSENLKSDKVMTNVLGLTRGHPGAFHNPYLVRNVKVLPLSKTNVVQQNHAEISSSESDFVAEMSEDELDQKKCRDFWDDASSSHNVVLSELVSIEQKTEVIISQPVEDIPSVESVSNSVENLPSLNPIIIEDPKTDTLNSTESDQDTSKSNVHEINNVTESEETYENLEEMNEYLDQEISSIKLKQRKNMSVSDTVNAGMISDVKELLTIFGVPYIDAPGEAEAQCAELCNLALCDGVITDDSDIFLFGNVCVYKDVFKKDRDIKCFTSTTIEDEFALSRERLIELAQLVGSDYCSGVRGVGCVYGMEILSKYTDLDAFVSEVKEDKIEAKYKKFDFSNLPNIKARTAYLNPSVNNSTEAFSWSSPDINLIKDFTAQKLNWTGQKVEDTLAPVLKVLNSATTQKSIHEFFQVHHSSSEGAMRAVKNSKSKGRKRTRVPAKTQIINSKKVKCLSSEESD